MIELVLGGAALLLALWWMRGAITCQGKRLPPGPPPTLIAGNMKVFEAHSCEI